MGKMTATMVKALKDAGRYGDGDGLFLLVSNYRREIMGLSCSKKWQASGFWSGKREKGFAFPCERARTNGALSNQIRY